jgi:hypothetical protein
VKSEDHNILVGAHYGKREFDETAVIRPKRDRLTLPPYHDAELTIILARRGFDYRASFRCMASLKLADEASDTLVPGCESAAVHQILPDRHGVPATRESLGNDFAVRLAGACRRAAAGFRFTGLGAVELRAKVGAHLIIGRFCRSGFLHRCSGSLHRRRVGDHLYGRFWIVPSPAARRPQRNACPFQVTRRSLAPNSRSALDSAQRPSQPTQGYDLLFLFFVQDVTHIDGAYPSPELNVLNSRFKSLYRWPVLK